MNLSKVFTLSLLLISSAALARVQMHTRAELKNDPIFGNRICDVVFNINVNALEIYNHDNIRVIAELLAEKEDNCIVSFTIFAKNDVDQWEQIKNPVLIPNYTETALLRMASSQGDSFTLEVDARKI